VEKEQQKRAIEALLFLSEEPVKPDKIAAALSTTPGEAEEIIGELQDDLFSQGRGLQIFQAAGGYQMGTQPELAPVLEKTFSEEVSSNLSNAALEVLAIVAYKQPVTRIEIESIRGVRSQHVLDNLLKRKLIKINGRKEGPGRPLLYVTTADFLKYFGLKELGDLPELELETDEAAESTNQEEEGTAPTPDSKPGSDPTEDSKQGGNGLFFDTGSEEDQPPE